MEFYEENIVNLTEFFFKFDNQKFDWKFCVYQKYKIECDGESRGRDDEHRLHHGPSRHGEVLQSKVIVHQEGRVARHVRDPFGRGNRRRQPPAVIVWLIDHLHDVGDRETERFVLKESSVHSSFPPLMSNMVSCVQLGPIFTTTTNLQCFNGFFKRTNEQVDSNFCFRNDFQIIVDKFPPNFCLNEILVWKVLSEQKKF